jgi:hypothetical protein
MLLLQELHNIRNRLAGFSQYLTCCVARTASHLALVPGTP